VEHGDTYSQSAKWGGITGGKHRRELHGTDARKARKNEYVPNGNKLMMPYRVAIALQNAGWCVRQDVIWAKPSPMPESVSGWSWQRCKVKIGRVPVEHGGLSSWDMGDHAHGDSGAYRGEPKTVAQWADCPGCSKCDPHDGYVLRKGQWRPTTGHEVILQITQGENYFCDATAAAEVAVGGSPGNKTHKGATAYAAGDEKMRTKVGLTQMCASATRNPRSVWRFSSESYKGAHFATYPTELPFRCITASTSKAGVCPTCGSQYAPVTSKERRPTRPGETTKVPGRNSRAFQERDPQHTGEYKAERYELEVGNRDPERHVTETVVSGYRPSCSCRVLPPIPATVYDPFGGSGTTVQVAHHMGRHGVCSELSGDYRGLAEARILKRPKCLEPQKTPKKPRRVIHKQQRELFAAEPSNQGDRLRNPGHERR